MAKSRIEHFLTKVLFINPNYRTELVGLSSSAADSIFSVASTANFVEEEPTAWEWIRKTLPTGSTFANYIRSLFPFTAWIMHYNLQWLIGDIIAGKHMVQPVLGIV